ncbi:MAG: type II toxin-antitoxin system VapC family toxin [Planctomycetota bacterium]|jgi:predicted nucleic acid-binding protein
MIITIDASAAVEIVLGRKKADSFAEEITQAELVITPSLYTAEVTNVFWKYYQHSDMPVNECERGLAAALKIPDKIVDIEDMAAETLNTAFITGMTVYDMFYMVLARRYNAHLMTLDKKLAKASVKQGISIIK